jgi:hypothetical protein
MGTTRFVGGKPIWHTWEPLKVKFFTWLAIRHRIWTADRRLHRSLQNVPACRLCDQEPENAEHLFLQCSFTKQIWHVIFSALSITLPGP